MSTNINKMVGFGGVVGVKDFSRITPSTTFRDAIHVQNQPKCVKCCISEMTERVVLEKSLTLTTPPKPTILFIFVLLHHHSKTTPSASFLLCKT